MNKSPKGFTLIETVVVIAVISITLPVLIFIIMSLMRMQLKINRLNQVKREGDYIINTIENSIRDKAVSIHSTIPLEDNIECSTDNSTFSGSSLYFLDKTGKWFGYEGGINTIASTSTISTINLTSSNITISGFSIRCSRKAIFSPPTVAISFTIGFNSNSTRPEEISSMFYQTRIKLRNY